MEPKISVYFKNCVCYLCIVLTVIIDCLDEIVIQTCRRGLKLTHERLSSKSDNKTDESKNSYEFINTKLSEIDNRMNNMVHEKYLDVVKLIQYRSICINKKIHSFTLTNCYNENSFIIGDILIYDNTETLQSKQISRIRDNTKDWFLVELSEPIIFKRIEFIKLYGCYKLNVKFMTDDENEWFTTITVHKNIIHNIVTLVS